MGTKYDNANWMRCARTYDVLMSMMGIAGVPNVAQGNDGVSLPCRGCWVQKREQTDSTIKMSIGTPASAVFGIELGQPFLLGPPNLEGATPMWVPVSDVSQLYFYGDNGTTVDIMYLLG